MKQKLYDKLFHWEKISIGQSAAMIGGARRAGRYWKNFKSYMTGAVILYLKNIDTRTDTIPLQIVYKTIDAGKMKPERISQRPRHLR